MTRESIAFLLDSAAGAWTSQEDRHLRLSETLFRRGVQPVLVFSAPLDATIRARLRASGAEVEAIDYGKGVVHYHRELRRLRRRFNITTAHIVFFDYFSALPWIARLSGIRHVIYEMQNSGEFRATSWRKWLLRLRTKVMMRPIGTVIAISEFVRQQLIAGGLAQHRIVVRLLGVDAERFRPEPRAREDWATKLALRPDELILSTVSYLRPFKNPQVLVAACKEWEGRGVRARLVVAGGGEMLPGLQEQAERLGVADRIHWLGNVADPRSLLQASDIFLLASVGEAFGLVLTEAMACGVPVVGSRSGSLPEVVEDGRTGLLSPPLDAVGLADSIERLARDVDLRREMGRQALERVREHFTVEMVVEKTIQIYESIWNGQFRGS